MDTMMIDTEYKTEFIRIMDEVFEDFDFDFELDFSIFSIFKSKKSKE
jgi:hypothetical protein